MVFWKFAKHDSSEISKGGVTYISGEFRLLRRGGVITWNFYYQKFNDNLPAHVHISLSTSEAQKEH